MSKFHLSPVGGHAHNDGHTHPSSYDSFFPNEFVTSENVDQLLTRLASEFENDAVWAERTGGELHETANKHCDILVNFAKKWLIENQVQPKRKPRTTEAPPTVWFPSGADCPDDQVQSGETQQLVFFKCSTLIRLKRIIFF